MTSTHLCCKKCEGQFDYLLGAMGWLYRGHGDVIIITEDGTRHHTSSFKFFNRHCIACPYCHWSSIYKVNLTES